MNVIIIQRSLLTYAVQLPFHIRGNRFQTILVVSLLRIGVRRIRTITEVHFAPVKALITGTVESGKESYFYMPYLIAAIKILAQYVKAVKV